MIAKLETCLFHEIWSLFVHLVPKFAVRDFETISLAPGDICFVRRSVSQADNAYVVGSDLCLESHAC